MVTPGVLSYPVLGIKWLGPVDIQAKAANVAALQASTHSTVVQQTT